MNPGPCKDCRERYVGCHGKMKDGTWRCEAWGRWQEEQAVDRERSAAERFQRQVQRDYICESKERFRRMKEQGKPKRR